MNDPKLLLADEPSGNLDVKTGEKVMDFFFALVRQHQISTILVTHILVLDKKFDGIWRLEKGLLRELKK